MTPRQQKLKKRQYQKDWYRRTRDKMLLELGGICVHCGCDEIRQLEFDHKTDRDWDVRAVGSNSRLRIYREEIAAGLIQVACKSCNSSRGAPGSGPVETEIDDDRF